MPAVKAPNKPELFLPVRLTPLTKQVTLIFFFF